MMEGSGFLTKDRIRKAQDIKVEEVFVPEWGDKVLVCNLTAAGKNAYEAEVLDFSGKGHRVRMENASVRLIVRCVLDPEAWGRGETKLLFSSSDMEWLGTKSSAAIERIVTVAQRLSAMTKEETEAIIKNSEAAQTGDSPSASL